MAHPVKCVYCGHTFDRDKVPCAPIPHGKRTRYAHEACHQRIEVAKREDEENKIKLEEYIKELFDYQVLPYKVNKQIQSYLTEKNYA